MHLHRKKQNAMDTREIIEHLMHPWNSYIVTKFHDMVSQGPVYVCTCCDQLWYKHSVLHADKLRHSNPEEKC